MEPWEPWYGCPFTCFSWSIPRGTSRTHDAHEAPPRLEMNHTSIRGVTIAEGGRLVRDDLPTVAARRAGRMQMAILSHESMAVRPNAAS